MGKWEYKLVKPVAIPTKVGPAWEARDGSGAYMDLNELGAQGWEAVSYAYHPDHPATGPEILFKRPSDDEGVRVSFES